MSLTLIIDLCLGAVVVVAVVNTSWALRFSRPLQR